MTAALRKHQPWPDHGADHQQPRAPQCPGPEIYAAGVEALNVAESSTEVRSVVITGEGSTFCAGGNLNRLQANRQSRRGAGAEHRRPAQLDRGDPHLPQAGDRRRRRRGRRRRFFAGAGLRPDRGRRDAVFVMAYSTVALSPDGGGSWSLARPAAPAGHRAADVRRAHRREAPARAGHGQPPVRRPARRCTDALALADA
jgi:hypothetical protein